MLIAGLVSLAVRQCFAEHVALQEAGDIVEAFANEVIVHVGDDLPATDYQSVLANIPVLEPPVRRIAGPKAGPAEMAAALEFVLEGLHLTKTSTSGNPKTCSSLFSMNYSKRETWTKS